MEQKQLWLLLQAYMPAEDYEQLMVHFHVINKHAFALKCARAECDEWVKSKMKAQSNKLRPLSEAMVVEAEKPGWTK